MEFENLIRTALGAERTPFGFQERFARAETLPSTIRVPTGLGKTATVVLGWLWRRFYASPDIRNATPRRLAYCLPMRTLVEQTRGSAETWIEKLGMSGELDVRVLMGGEQAEDWDLHPERPAILIGTQDMLLSRALNRGYGVSRYRWPLPFGLLNNDCLWVFDEVQLMDVGVKTSAQLEAFRASMGNFGAAQSVWMSATLKEDWLETVDLPKGRLGRPLELDDKDHANDYVRKLWTAAKPLSQSAALMGDAKACAQAIAEAHRAGTRSLAVFNTVDRAAEVYRHLRKRRDVPAPVLIHSRFRAEDRKKHLSALLDKDEVIAVTTQVVEAGVDVSATTLLTELAPWASLTQRFGRCNRKGNDKEARVIWFDPGDIDDAFKSALPYDAAELRAARDLLRNLENVSLEALDRTEVEMPLDAAHVIRRRDMVDLFDTTPDLAGNDIDVSRFIRSGDEHDVQVFWREFEDNSAETEPAPRREELCSVPVGKFREFRKKNPDDVLRWDGLEEKWRKAEEREIYPGQTFLVRCKAGGYDAQVGWNPKSGEAVKPLFPGDKRPDANERPDANGRDFEGASWLSIAEHTDDVMDKLASILEAAPLEPPAGEVLQEAARRHDWGKAHPVFQRAVKDEERPQDWQERDDIGKAPNKFWKKYERMGFRHELASALAMTAAGMSDLSVYLAAAHHGKVRLSIRSLPKEKPPPRADRLYARGVWDRDEIGAIDLGGGVCAAPAALSLECMQMGRSASGSPSWAERMLRLRDEWGPFRLAYLEALLRAADMRASREEATQRPGGAG